MKLLIPHLLLRLRIVELYLHILACIHVVALKEARKKFYDYELYGVFAVWLKLPEREANHAHPSTTEVKNEWSFNSNSLCIFLAWYIYVLRCVQSEYENKKEGWYMIKKDFRFGSKI